MEKIIHNRMLMGVRISSISYGSTPRTHKDEPLQLITFKHKQGTYLKPHIHIPKKRVTERLQECLIVRRGRIKIDLYDDSQKMFTYLYLKASQIFILMRGGYGIHILEDSEIIEVKNGPFKEDKVLIEA